MLGRANKKSSRLPALQHWTQANKMGTSRFRRVPLALIVYLAVQRVSALEGFEAASHSVSASLDSFEGAPHWPRTGIYTGENAITWGTGCCDGDLVILDFRDEMGDGNAGTGLLHLSNASHGTVASYEIGPFHGLWRTFGPYCAPTGQHTLSFTSDANPIETTLTVIDSFGLVRGKAGSASARSRRAHPSNLPLAPVLRMMLSLCLRASADSSLVLVNSCCFPLDAAPPSLPPPPTRACAPAVHDLPITFNTSAPSKFCSEPDGLSEELKKERARKHLARHFQFTPRGKMEELGFVPPHDRGYTVLPPPKS